MADYQFVSDSEIDPGSPVNTSLMTRLARNPEAIAEGDPGAPPVEVAALGRPTVGEVQRFFDSSLYSGPVGNFVAFSVTMAGQGALRIRFTHSNGNSARSSSARILHNGVIVGTWSTNSTSGVIRTLDVTFAPGDRIEIEGVPNNTDETGVRDITLLTGGEGLIPLSENTNWSYS